MPHSTSYTKRRAPREWVALQRSLAAEVSLSDRDAPFYMPWSSNSTPSPAMRPPASTSTSSPTIAGTVGLENETAELESKSATTDHSNELSSRRPLSVVAGVDVSFVADTDVAVASCVIMSFPELRVLHKEMLHCRMPVPYFAGFLAFREVVPLQRVLNAARLNSGLDPQVIFVDGNGVLHYRRCGLASHLGVLEGVPTVGCAKRILVLDGLDKEYVQDQLAEKAAHRTGHNDQRGTGKKVDPVVCPLVGISGRLWGHAALTGNSTKNPIYISAGHMISQESAVRLTLAIAPFRVVEPIRQADLLSRKYIQQNEAALYKEAEGRAPPPPPLAEMSTPRLGRNRGAAASLPVDGGAQTRIQPNSSTTFRQALSSSPALGEEMTKMPPAEPKPSVLDDLSSDGKPPAPPAFPGFPAPVPFTGYHVVAKNIPTAFVETDMLQLLHTKVPACRGMAIEDGVTSIQGRDAACRSAKFCLAAPVVEHQRHVDSLRARIPTIGGRAVFFDLLRKAIRRR